VLFYLVQSLVQEVQIVVVKRRLQRTESLCGIFIKHQEKDKWVIAGLACRKIPRSASNINRKSHGSEFLNSFLIIHEVRSFKCVVDDHKFLGS
jgi:hypothetical protein